jgi:hypothetical protein
LVAAFFTAPGTTSTSNSGNLAFSFLKTKGSTDDDADLTNSLISASLLITSLLSTSAA